MLPEGWSASTLGELADVQRGKFSARPRNDPAFFGGEYPFVQTGDVSNSAIRLTGHSQTLNDSGLAVSKIFPADTILMTIAANIGDVAITTYPVACPDSLVGIIPYSDKAEPIWLLHALMIEKEGLDRSAPKMAQKNINLEVLRPLRLLSPPLPEQRKIADILSTWDAAIENTEALLASAKAQKRALMQSLLTGKRRFPEFEGQPWKEVRLGDVASVAMGSSPKSSAYNDKEMGLPLIQGNADVKDGRSAPRIFTSEITTTCAPGDILLSVRAPVGSVAISDHHACVGRGAAVIRPSAGHDWLWLKHLMLWLEPQWARVSQGSTFEAVNSKELKTFGVPMPATIQEEHMIGTAVEASHLECTTLVAQIAKLRTEKKALMQQLLTGKRRVVV